LQETFRFPVITMEMVNTTKLSIELELGISIAPQLVAAVWSLALALIERFHDLTCHSSNSL
jgi:hypothetical protein